MSEQHQYLIGPDPDRSSRDDHHCNGVWHTEADCLDTALTVIFNSMSFPGEATGRQEFVPGVSLAGRPAHEVIQVWSDEPGATVKRQRRRLEIGLLREIALEDLPRWLQPEHKLLGYHDASDDQNPAPIISEMGRSVSEFVNQRQALRQTVQAQQMDLAVQRWNLSGQQERLKEQMRHMEQKIFLADTYLHGCKSVKQISSGTPANGPYSVFQTRQFLNQEIALLANLTKFDFSELPDLDQWLLKSGALWKFLPFPRTILVTRIRDKDKSYGDIWADLFNNIDNRISLVWLRDGKNVWRITTDLDFQNCVFPDSFEAQRVTNHVTESVFKQIFSAEEESKPKWYHTTPPPPEIPGTLKAEAVEEHEPYRTRAIVPQRFTRIEDWKDCEEYTTKIEVEIAREVGQHLAEHNRERLTFMVFLQGLADNTNLLDIPKGTDLLNWRNASTFFTLVRDYSHGLPDGQLRDLWAAASRVDQLKVGDFIIADAFVVNRLGVRSDSDRYSTLWRFYRIHKFEAEKPVVLHQCRSRRYPYDPVKKASPITLNPEKISFLRADLPLSLAKQLLNDRAWKADHLDLIPLLAQWSYVQKQFLQATNFTPIKLKETRDRS